jgi:ribosomal protein L33
MFWTSLVERKFELTCEECENINYMIKFTISYKLKLL